MKKNGTSRHALAIVSHQQLVEIKSLLASTIAVWVNLKQPPQVLAGSPLTPAWMRILTNPRWRSVVYTIAASGFFSLLELVHLRVGSLEAWYSYIVHLSDGNPFSVNFINFIFHHLNLLFVRMRRSILDTSSLNLPSQCLMLLSYRCQLMSRCHQLWPQSRGAIGKCSTTYPTEVRPTEIN